MNIWNFIEQELSGGNTVMLITVTQRKGSSPGIVGFKMAVSQSGALSGSIGGGLMEYNMVDLARNQLKLGNQNIFLNRQVHNPNAGKDSSGMICSGEQEHAFLFLDASKLELIQKIVICLGSLKNGALQISNKGIEFDETRVLKKTSDYQFTNIDKWVYAEQLGLKPTLYIFGAGHVSVPLSQIFSILDFNVEIFDNRENLSTFEGNAFAHKRSIVDYTAVANLVPEGENSFVVVMTVSHSSDTLLLKQLIAKQFKYIGMIGSKIKIKNIFDSLRAVGISESDLAKVDAPIGLPIKSKTTSEIAISIAAKVIEVKNI